MKDHMEQYRSLLRAHDVFWYEKGKNYGKIYCFAKWKPDQIPISNFSRSGDNALLRAFCLKYNVNFNQLARYVGP